MAHQTIRAEPSASNLDPDDMPKSLVLRAVDLPAMINKQSFAVLQSVFWRQNLDARSRSSLKEQRATIGPYLQELSVACLSKICRLPTFPQVLYRLQVSSDYTYDCSARGSQSLPWSEGTKRRTLNAACCYIGSRGPEVSSSILT